VAVWNFRNSQTLLLTHTGEHQPYFRRLRGIGVSVNHFPCHKSSRANNPEGSIGREHLTNHWRSAKQAHAFSAVVDSYYFITVGICIGTNTDYLATTVTLPKTVEIALVSRRISPY
jgi:hypothetical protein